MPGKFGEGLAHRVSVYVPGTSDVNLALSDSAHELFVNRAIRFMSEQFGGATAVPAIGGYVAAADGQLILERITVVYAATGDLSTAVLDSVYGFAVALGKELGQGAVAVEIDGALYFVG